MTTDIEIAGYRVMDTEPVIGTELRHSFIWDGDEMTDVALSGTCAFATLESARAYGRYSRGFWIVALAGERKGWGDLAGEVIIRNAVIAEVVEQIC